MGWATPCAAFLDVIGLAGPYRKENNELCILIWSSRAIYIFLVSGTALNTGLQLFVIVKQ